MLLAGSDLSAAAAAAAVCRPLCAAGGGCTPVVLLLVKCACLSRQTAACTCDLNPKHNIWLAQHTALCTCGIISESIAACQPHQLGLKLTKQASVSLNTTNGWCKRQFCADAMSAACTPALVTCRKLGGAALILVRRQPDSCGVAAVGMNTQGLLLLLPCLLRVRGARSPGPPATDGMYMCSLCT